MAEEGKKVWGTGNSEPNRAQESNNDLRMEEGKRGPHSMFNVYIPSNYVEGKNLKGMHQN